VILLARRSGHVSSGNGPPPFFLPFLQRPLSLVVPVLKHVWSAPKTPHTVWSTPSIFAKKEKKKEKTEIWFVFESRGSFYPRRIFFNVGKIITAIEYPYLFFSRLQIINNGHIAYTGGTGGKIQNTTMQ
jgi:hypothetical protein